MSNKLKKIVNGKLVELSVKDSHALELEWKKNEKESLLERQLEGWKAGRLRAYPKIGDQLDAILKQLNYMEVHLIDEMQAIINSWESVKRKYPKPEK